MPDALYFTHRHTPLLLLSSSATRYERRFVIATPAVTRQANRRRTVFATITPEEQLRHMRAARSGSHDATRYAHAAAAAPSSTQPDAR